MIFIFILLLSPALFIVPAHKKGKFALILLAAGIVQTFSIITRLEAAAPIDLSYDLGIINLRLYIDELSALFLALLNVVAITALWYSNEYLKTYIKTKSESELSLHFLAYIWLYVSMTAVITFRDTASFLLAWELMTGASFVLVVFEGEKPDKLKAAIHYLVQMHVCLFLLIAGFAIAESASDKTGFEAVAEYFSTRKNFPLFLIFLLGFGFKAGFVPMHTWLPEVHPTASGNVSGFMSGAIIKMGIYGLIRIISCIKTDLFLVGATLLSLSCVTGLYGIAMAAVQKDIKKLLAYSSIENIGIIGIALSIGILGEYWDNPALSLAGYAGALLHTFNHACFKSMLFFSAGSLCKATHTQRMDKMGGAAKEMPYTAAFFLLGSGAICALPPLSGFVSEFLIYKGLFSSIGDAGSVRAFFLMIIALIMVVIGGLSILTFTKAFGIPFLGLPRSPQSSGLSESKGLWTPLLIPAFCIIFVGFAPFFAFELIARISFCVSMADSPTIIAMNECSTNLRSLSLVFMLFAGLIVGIHLLRSKRLAKRRVDSSPTWGCGYTAPKAKMQYSSSSFVSDFEHLANPVTRYRREIEPIAETEIFPDERKFKGKSEDIVHSQVNILQSRIQKILSHLAIFQTGRIQHYISFALIFMVIIFVLSWIMQ
ncbi:MAG: NADH-quinone oxidoreductase subunit E [Prevotellaceae bacterium]|jgi:formate hydrogenlyase subunit 3/multisubunit Na+/H+ antiporter MnhD subunit|nr:NADH-quinone oxidoreductase subunit E [Prevotellaceae bacterium]